MATRFGAATAVEAQPRDQAASRFTLLDQRGIQRGVFEVNGDGVARVVVTGPNTQTPQVSAFVSPGEGAGIVLRDGGGGARVTTEVRGDGSIVMGVLGGRNSALRAALTMYPDSRGGLELRDNQGRVRAAFVVAGDGTPTLALYDEEGEKVWSAP
ncbi:MAG: hypothetical protein HYX51_11520 [Chloroflexi bacterium]|nr:hypothetical protein [Chloroflexota bacterium]